MVLEKKGRSHEHDHARKHEADFKALAKRNKKLGLWLAEQFNLQGGEAESYAKDVVLADLDEPGDEDVIRKVMADIATHGVNISEAEIREKLVTYLDEVLAESD
ncbi:MAG: DUF1476 domain-containing protein [Magnetospiraceae bacterium]